MSAIATAVSEKKGSFLEFRSWRDIIFGTGVMGFSEPLFCAESIPHQWDQGCVKICAGRLFPSTANILGRSPTRRDHGAPACCSRIISEPPDGQLVNTNNFTMIFDFTHLHLLKQLQPLDIVPHVNEQPFADDVCDGLMWPRVLGDYIMGS